MKAVIYVRQSLDKSGEELGIDRQLRECERFARERGYQVDRTIQDNNRSATTGERPGYNQLIQLIEAGSVEVVVAYRLDRLLRRLIDLEALIELSERTGVQVATVQGDIDLTNSQGRLIGRILASVARSEMETKSERHRLANAQKAMAGKPHGSRRPYGYEADLVTIRESEASILRACAQRVIDGWSYKKVAHWLNQEGHVTTFGKPFYPVTVRNMLRKKRYGGLREYQGVDYPAQWPAVLDPQTWERLQLVIDRRSNQSHHERGRKFMLTGLLVCGRCGLRLTGTKLKDGWDAKRGRTRLGGRIYACRGIRDTGLERGCGGVRRNADALDHYIREEVLYRLDSPEMAELLSEQTDTAQLRELTIEREARQNKLDRLVDDYASDLLSREQFARAKGVAELELAQVDEQLARLHGQSVSVSLEVGETLRQAWIKNDDEWRRSIVELLIKRITVNPGTTKPFYDIDGKRARFDPNLIDVEWIA